VTAHTRDSAADVFREAAKTARELAALFHAQALPTLASHYDAEARRLSERADNLQGAEVQS
jgi:hypothetical protein